MQPTHEQIVRRAVAERERTGQATATAERLLRAGEDGFEITESQGQRIVDAPLERLWKKGEITQREYEAGEEFRRYAAQAGIDPAAPSVDLNRVGGGFGSGTPSAFSSDAALTARRRWRMIEKVFPKTSIVWTTLWLGVVKERSLDELGALLFGRKGNEGSRAAGAAGFRVALAALADIRERD